MANVVDPNSWRMIPPSDPQRPVQSTPRAGPEEHGGEAVSPQVDRQAKASSAITGLSTALGKTFNSQNDHVVWNLAPSMPGQTSGGEYMRVDMQHATRAPAALGPPAPQDGADSKRAAARPWLVIVENVRDVAASERFDQLQPALATEPQLLLIACDVEDPTAAESESLEDTGARGLAMAARLRCRYVGPIGAGDIGQLVETLEHIKQLWQPTLLHLDARGATAPSPHFTRRADHREPAAPDAGSLRSIASQALVELARGDERIVAVSTDVEEALADDWLVLPGRLYPVDSGVPYALSWCASLAAGGSRPFAFLSCDEGQDSLGQIRRDICLKRAPVTLILESRGQSGPSGSSCLAGIRQLPDISLLAPKDAAELRQMLAWCAAQDDPAVVWLPQEFEPQVNWPWGSDIVLGRSEPLSQGRDVAIVAWGPMTAAATIAAESLALSGLEATVINARFACPLDVETIARVARQATYVVLVDDLEQTGGFAGWVLEHLLRAGVVQPISIVAPPETADRQDHHDLHNQCALAIVERCRWLAEPIVPRVTIEPPLPETDDETRTLAGNWQRFVGRHAERTARERAQVYARELSYDTRRWVAAYEEVGPRDVYLWKWCTHGVELTTLPCVVPELRAHVCDTKMLSIVLCVLLDDVADQHGSTHLLDALLELTCWGVSRSLHGLSTAQRRHAQIARALWGEYQSRIAGYPCYDTFEPVLHYDLLQFFNTMRYSHLVNGRPYLLNMVEHDLYTSHNMMMISFSTLDLMCGPGFPQEEVGTLREAIWHAQCMGRIGNLLSTWRRELVKRDFTSGVFARAMMEGDLTLEELENGDPSELEATIRNRGHEAYFFGKWLEHRERCHARARHISSLDLRSVLEAHDRFFAMHLGSQGLI